MKSSATLRPESSASSAALRAVIVVVVLTVATWVRNGGILISPCRVPPCRHGIYFSHTFKSSIEVPREVMSSELTPPQGTAFRLTRGTDGDVRTVVAAAGSTGGYGKGGRGWDFRDMRKTTGMIMSTVQRVPHCACLQRSNSPSTTGGWHRGLGCMPLPYSAWMSSKMDTREI